MAGWAFAIKWGDDDPEIWSRYKLKLNRSFSVTSAVSIPFLIKQTNFDMKLHFLALFVGSVAYGGTVSFRDNKIDAEEISGVYISWQLVPGGKLQFPAQRVTRPQHDDATLLRATNRLNGAADYYAAQADASFEPGHLVTLTGGLQLSQYWPWLQLMHHCIGPEGFPHAGSIIHIDDKEAGVKTEWKLLDANGDVRTFFLRMKSWHLLILTCSRPRNWNNWSIIEDLTIYPWKRCLGL